MKFDSVSLLAGCIADNITIISGAALPAGSIGELFYKTGTDDGLYYHDGVQWIRIGTDAGGNTSPIGSGADLPTSGMYAGQVFIKTSPPDENTYVYNGEEWIAPVAAVIPAPSGPSGNLWTWGTNDNGSLGLGDTVYRSSPTQVGALNTWKSVSAGQGTVAAIKNDGTLWSWGIGFGGSLGHGDYIDRSFPVQVGSLTNWKETKFGSYSAVAIKTDGTLWTWGTNDGFGSVLGLGEDNNSYPSPVQIGLQNDWKTVSHRNYLSLVIKNDGSLWSWGWNIDGCCGLGYAASPGFGYFDNVSVPTQIGLLTDWKMANMNGFFAAAIKTDGTLWVWGRNSYGQLGLGNTDNYYSPVQVGSATDWKFVSAGTDFTLAIKTDDTLWAWGANYFGQLGLGTLTDISSPVQVGALTNWKSVIGGYGQVLAIKTDGTLWGWGDNYNGELGLGNNDGYSSPVQVGLATDWKFVDTVYGNVVAIR